MDYTNKADCMKKDCSKKEKKDKKLNLKDVFTYKKK